MEARQKVLSKPFAKGLLVWRVSGLWHMRLARACFGVAVLSLFHSLFKGLLSCCEQRFFPFDQIMPDVVLLRLTKSCLIDHCPNFCHHLIYIECRVCVCVCVCVFVVYVACVDRWDEVCACYCMHVVFVNIVDVCVGKMLLLLALMCIGTLELCVFLA